MFVGPVSPGMVAALDSSVTGAFPGGTGMRCGLAAGSAGKA
jgi:hypothetical protein